MEKIIELIIVICGIIVMIGLGSVGLSFAREIGTGKGLKGLAFLYATGSIILFVGSVILAYIVIQKLR